MLGWQRAAIHLVSDQDIRLTPHRWKILNVGIDSNAAEVTKVRAVGPNVPGGCLWPTVR